MTGRTWDDDTTDFRGAPDQYAAVHFHEDDVEDAGWPPLAELVVPAGLRSGVYAFRLTAGSLTDHVPFVVTPPRGQATARIGLLLPTLTYLAYANERLIAAGEGGMVPAGQAARLDEADTWLSAHPEAGLSAYDRHADGTRVLAGIDAAAGPELPARLRVVEHRRPRTLRRRSLHHRLS